MRDEWTASRLTSSGRVHRRTKFLKIFRIRGYRGDALFDEGVVVSLGMVALDGQ